MITEELMPALQGIVPAWVVTTSAENVPNCTCVSQVYPVDETHVALSNQFFSKTFRNLGNNPRAMVQVIHPQDNCMWLLETEHVRTETDGPLFDDMDMQLAAIASMSNMQDVFKLQSAYVLKVHSVTQLSEAQIPATSS
jgi:hypothetical protein